MVLQSPVKPALRNLSRPRRGLAVLLSEMEISHKF